MQYSKISNLSKSFVLQNSLKVNITNISAIHTTQSKGSSDSNSFFNKSDNPNKNDPKKYSGIRKVSIFQIFN